MNSIYEYYGVYHMPAQAYVNSYGYQYSIGCVQAYSCDSLDEATKQANDIINAGFFKAKDLVIHKLNIVVSQAINISPNRETDYE